MTHLELTRLEPPETKEKPADGQSILAGSHTTYITQLRMFSYHSSGTIRNLNPEKMFPHTEHAPHRCCCQDPSLYQWL